MKPNISPINIIQPEKNFEIHKAGWVMVDPWHIIENGSVLVENYVIKKIFQNKSFHDSNSTVPIFDHGNGVLMSPLINAHTHFELSCFKNKLSVDHTIENTFETWVRDLLSLREQTEEKVVKEYAKASMDDLFNSGTLYAGDISTTGVTQKLFQESKLSGIWFHEFLGSVIDEKAVDFFEKSGKVHCSVAGHAPHTTSPDLLKYKKELANLKGLPFPIHVEESIAEKEFISTGKGKWADFLQERSIDFSFWGLPQKSSIRHLMNHSILDPLTLLVHVLNSDDEDFRIIAESGAKVCVCPRSNMNLHGKLPQIEKMLDMGIKPAIGTDSLASCDSLCVFDEMKYIKAHFETIDLAIIIAMATQYGADALGMGDKTGSIEKGKRAEMLYIPLDVKTKTELLEKIILYE